MRTKAGISSVRASRVSRVARSPRTPVLSKTTTGAAPCVGWNSAKTGQRRLFGCFNRLGLAVEHHQFSAQEPVDWSQSFHEHSLEICLNVAGDGHVQDKTRQSRFTPHTAGFYCNARHDLGARREANQAHAFITIEMSRPFITEQLEGAADALHPAVRKWMGRTGGAGHAGSVMPMTPAMRSLFLALGTPPIAPAAYPLWYQSKALELLCQLLFAAPPSNELFCQRHKRLTQERVEKTVSILRAQYAEPPDLETLGREIGCSPFYLSRLFSKETGMTLSQYIREVRMQRAAELLLGGRHNVTEAALQVGYSSLSHFSKAFCHSIGCCPTLFPQAKALVEKFHARRQAGW